MSQIWPGWSKWKYDQEAKQWWKEECRQRFYLCSFGRPTAELVYRLVCTQLFISKCLSYVVVRLQNNYASHVLVAGAPCVAFEEES